MEALNYSERLNKLKNRRQDQDMIKKAMEYGEMETLNESYELLNETRSVKYAIGAMEPVDLKYTDNTYKEGERVKNQLEKIQDKGFNIEFKYQGSVTNNTHIKAHSDIDILTINSDFFTLESPQKASSPYEGDPVAELCKMREECYTLLKNAFHAANVDNGGSKSISLEGGSLRRKIDIVPSNWYHTIKYSETGLEYYKGVMVLDYENKTRFANTPFYHNKLLADKDNRASNNFKKIVRLLKTLKADSEQDINLSSYDITSLMYHMEDSEYAIGDSPLLLIRNSYEFLKQVYVNSDYRSSLKVPDESRKIFEPNRANISDLRLLTTELERLYQDIVKDLEGNINKSIIA